MSHTRLSGVLLLVLLSACQSNAERTHRALFETHQRQAIANLETRLVNSLEMTDFSPAVITDCP